MSASDSASNETPGLASMTGDTSRQTSDVGTTARKDLGGIGEELKHQAEALTEEAKTQVAEAARRAKTMAGEQKDLIAVQLGSICNALEKVAMELEGNDEATAPYMRMIADRAESLSSAVRSNDVDSLMSMAEDFGRRQPLAFMGLAAIMGFAASRFVRASASRRAEQSLGGYAGSYGETDEIAKGSSYGAGTYSQQGASASAVTGSGGMGAGMGSTGMGTSGISGSGMGTMGTTGRSASSGLGSDPASVSSSSTGGIGSTGSSTRPGGTRTTKTDESSSGGSDE